MSRYRLQPTQTQEAALLRHCADARYVWNLYVWNLCVEQESWWLARRGRMPGFAERCRQLTAARQDNPWLAEGSVIVQQAIRAGSPGPGTGRGGAAASSTRSRS
jgi:hypothetical protein